jgi:glycosyltransferase involved in cell wall biosynthesis
MPLSILEAFAAGLPVVTSNAGGIPLLVSDRQTGLLVPSQDHQALAEAAMQLLANPDLALGIARRARLECNRYSWENVRGEWVRLYTELMQAP